MSKYILIFLWGAFTVAFWFLSFMKLGAQDMLLPNGFLAPAILSTIVAIVWGTIDTFIENKTKGKY